MPEERYPKLKWEVIDSCEDELLTDCANFICQLINKFNGVTNSFQKVISKRKSVEKKNAKLTERYLQLENCQKCVTLQKHLDDQNSKMQTLAQVFGQMSNENFEKSKGKLEIVHEMFTQIVDNKNSPKAVEIITNNDIVYGKRRLQSIESPEKYNTNITQGGCYNTPKKKYRSGDQKPPVLNPDCEVIKSQCDSSPILGKNRQRGTITRSQESNLPLANLSNRLDMSVTCINASPKMNSPPKIENSSEAFSPSLLANELEEDEKLFSSLPNKSPMDALTEDGKRQVEENKRDSLSLLQKKVVKKNTAENSSNQTKKCERSPKSKKLKQARLTFSHMKTKEPSDISLQGSFCGGLRTFSTDLDLTKVDDEEMLKIAVQLSLNESVKRNLYEDGDIIDASPSHREMVSYNKRLRKQKKHNHVTTLQRDHLLNITDDEDTIMCTQPSTTRSKKRSSKSPLKKCHTVTSDESHSNKNYAFLNSQEKENGENKKGQQKNALSPKSNPQQSFSKEPTFIYKEPVLRKKTEKANLPGWSCKKCKDFYEAAFKGNKDLIKEKMNECSKHRGKFNPERANTPAGFWDLNMPPTQLDTEAFNKINNKD